MAIKKTAKKTDRYRVNNKSINAIENRHLIRGSWFLSLLILVLLIIFSSAVIGGVLYDFFIKEVQAEVEKALLTKADNCELNLAPKEVLRVNATAYSSSPAQTDATPCVTATGYDVCLNYALYGADNTIASNFLPLHSVVKIPDIYGDKLFVVRDRMNQRYGRSYIDIWMPTYSMARRFGVQNVEIEVY
ncbi:hypothetical protein GF391_02650 [Candidatus Uhrbacteria bacterium]|nr:hypothetical protein [Candidatus Uhrbacteria bacterium]